MAEWTVPITWQNEDLVDSLDADDYIRGNLLFLRDEADSTGLISLRFPSVTAANRDPDWKTIHTGYMQTFGKRIYASLEFSVNNGADTWPAGTIFVGEGDTTDIVEKVGERITRVAIRNGYTRSATWQNLLRQRQAVAALISNIEDAKRIYDGVSEVFSRRGPWGGRAPLDYLNGRTLAVNLGITVSSSDERWLRWIANRYGNRANWWSGYFAGRNGQDDLNYQKQLKNQINARMRAEGVIWRHQDITIAGRDQKITESSQITRTRTTTQVETVTYDKVFMRLLFGNLSREFIHDGASSTETGAFYLWNVPAGNHEFKLQWRSPQFTGHEPQSGTLISLSNVNLQLKEVRYALLDRSI